MLSELFISLYCKTKAKTYTFLPFTNNFLCKHKWAPNSGTNQSKCIQAKPNPPLEVFQTGMFQFHMKAHYSILAIKLELMQLTSGVTGALVQVFFPQSSSSLLDVWPKTCDTSDLWHKWHCSLTGHKFIWRGFFFILFFLFPISQFTNTIFIHANVLHANYQSNMQSW